MLYSRKGERTGGEMIRQEIKQPAEAYEILKLMRTATGMSLAEMAELANLSKTSIHEIENGQVDARFANILNLAQLCGVKIVLEYRAPCEESAK